MGRSSRYPFRSPGAAERGRRSKTEIQKLEPAPVRIAAEIAKKRVSSEEPLTPQGRAFRRTLSDFLLRAGKTVQDLFLRNFPAFGQTLPTADIPGVAVATAMAFIPGEAVPDADELSPLLDHTIRDQYKSAAKDFSEGGIEQAVKILASTSMFRLFNGSGVDPAPIAHGPPVTTVNREAFDAAQTELGDLKPTADAIRDKHPYLTDLGQTSGIKVFDDLFPGEKGPGRDRDAVMRARDYARLSQSPVVGGVLIGRPAGSGRAEIVDIDWQVCPEGVSLSLRLAEGGKLIALPPYPARLIADALAYAADGRPVTVTILGKEVFLHPALINHPLGHTAIAFD